MIKEENLLEDEPAKEKSKIASVHIDYNHTKGYNTQSYASVQPETSQLTPEDLRDYIHKSTTNFSNVLCFSSKFNTNKLKE